MDLDQYLENDILVFLDGKIEKKSKEIYDREEEYGLYLTKDYLKELDQALENDEISKAKKLFDELKNKYNSLPKNSIEKKKIYAILEKMYQKIEAYIEMKEKTKIYSLEEGKTLRDSFKKDTLNETQTEKPLLKTEIGKMPSEPAIQIKKPKPSAESRRILENSIIAHLTEIEALLSQWFLIDARRKINTVKELSNRYENIFCCDDPDKESQDFSKDSGEKIKYLEEKILSLEKDLKNIKQEYFEKYKKHMDQKEEEATKKSILTKQKEFNEKQKKVPEIKKHEKSAHKDKPKHISQRTIEDLYVEGVYNMYRGNYKEAAEYFRKLLELKPLDRAAKIRLDECEEKLPK